MPHKYRVAIIGAGMICNAAHLPALTPLRKRGAVEVVAVADIRPEAARETAQRYEIPAWYDDPQKMLDEVKPDWVSVCTMLTAVMTTMRVVIRVPVSERALEIF